MKKNKKIESGQVSFEYLVISGFLIFVAAVFFVYSMFSINNNLTSDKAKQSANLIASYANSLYSSGEGSSIVIEVTLPENSTLSFLGKNVIIDYGNGNVYGYSVVDFTPVNLGTKQGNRVLKMTFIDGNILVTE
ncbi:MAG: hypothetical protein QXD98_03465 [Candidatus Diapherotrites archaeon]